MAEGNQQREQLPIYPWWDQVPEHLVTRKKFSELGLKAGGPVRARIQYTAHKQDRDYPLYDQREAVAKKQPTAAQRIALKRAQEALGTCKVCGQCRRSGAVWIAMDSAGGVSCAGSGSAAKLIRTTA